MKNAKNGFSLLELLIVVAVILIIATIAIPSFLRSRQSANESAAVASLRLIHIAQTAYASQRDSFAATLAELIDDGMIDQRFTGTSGGYDFAVELAVGGQAYDLTATASTQNQGRFDYYSASDAVIRYSTNPARAPTGRAGHPVE